jgi:hypothetical protein
VAAAATSPGMRGGGWGTPRLPVPSPWCRVVVIFLSSFGMRWEAVGVRASEVLDGMPLCEADERRRREWIGAARSCTHGVGVILVGVVLVEGERAEAGEARCGEWDGAEAQAPLASAAATHQTASRPNAPPPPPPPTSPDGVAALAGAPSSTWRRRHRAHRRRIRPREHRIERAEGRAELTTAGSGLASVGSKLGRQAPPARVSAWRRRTRPRRPRIWAAPARASERMESPGRRRRAEPNRYLPSGRCTRAAAPSFSIASPRPQR